MLLAFVSGVIVGAGGTLLTIFAEFKVKDREGWEKEKRESEAAYTCALKAAAENVKLRVALAAAEMTDGAKEVAAVTMAAFGEGIVGVDEVE